MTLQTYTPNQYPYQVSTSYTLRFPRYSPNKILWGKVTTARSNQSHTMMLYTYNSQPTSLPSVNFLHITVTKIYPRIRFSRLTSLRKGQRSTQGHTMNLKFNKHLHALTNVSTKYQLPTPYVFRDIAWTRFSNSRSLRHGQIMVTP